VRRRKKREGGKEKRNSLEMGYGPAQIVPFLLCLGSSPRFVLTVEMAEKRGLTAHIKERRGEGERKEKE